MSQLAVDPHVERVFEAFDARDAAGAAAQFAPDGTYHEVPRNERFTREEFREYLADEVFAAFPDYGVEERQPLTADDWATTVRWSFGGTHEGEGGWFEPTGNSVVLPVVSVVTLAEDGISTWRDFFDPRALVAQLGRE